MLGTGIASNLDLVFRCAVFAFGSCIASFLNVVIWRVPRGESIVSPPSHCPNCGAPIWWWQNIPVLSYLALRGRCAGCRTAISPRYAIVEVLGGALFLAAWLKLDVSVAGAADALIWLELIFWWVWIALMITGSFIDFDHKLLPDFVTVGGMVLGCVRGAAFSMIGMFENPQCAFSPAAFAPLLWSLAGLAFGFGLLWIVRCLGSRFFRREAMGMGDVFLMGAVGALFGPVAVFVTLMLSSIFGSVAGLSLMALSKVRLGRFAEIPYGPYICLGCLAWMFRGRELIAWYLQAFR